IVAVVGAIALGVAPGTLLLVCLVLLCPLSMYFGMSAMNQGCGHSGKCNHAEPPENWRKPQDYECPKAA
ncbi:MAG: hypothetical protein LC775_18605, partial [Acidobacteria bacterium]|nr:hypothetical protein [Acidobacteriota bacterium]